MSGEAVTLARAVGVYSDRRRRLGELTMDAGRRQERMLRRFVAEVGDRPASSLRTRHVERWAAAQVERGLAAGTRRLEWSVVRQFVRWLISTGQLARDPFEPLRQPRAPRSVPRPIDDDAVAALFAAAPDARARAVLALAIRCGLRVGEIARLRVEHWNRRDQLLWVIGKGGHTREVPVPTTVRRALEEYLEECGWPATGPMIRSAARPSRGVTPEHLSVSFARWARAAGVKRSARDGMTIHAGRHTAATRVVDRTGDVRAAQLLLGHADISTTMTYVRRINLAAVRAALEDDDVGPGEDDQAG